MLWPFLLTAAGFALAFVPVLLGIADLPAGLPEVVIAAGGLWGGLSWLRRRGKDGARKRAFVASILGLAAAFHLVWFFSISTYRDVDAAPRVGALAPAIKAVRVRDKAAFHLAAQRGRAMVLVFFRGGW